MAASLPAAALPAHPAACRPHSLPLLRSALHPEAPRRAPSPKAAGRGDARAAGCGRSGIVGQAPFQGEPVWDPTASPGPRPGQPDPAQGNGPLTLAPSWSSSQPHGGSCGAPRPGSGRAVTARLAGVPSEYFILHNITTQRCCSCTASA